MCMFFATRCNVLVVSLIVFVFVVGYMSIVLEYASSNFRWCNVTLVFMLIINDLF